MFIQCIDKFENVQTEQLSENINKELDNIFEWLNTIKLCLNVKKNPRNSWYFMIDNEK